MKVLIIGGVAGGATAAARLRRLDEKAEIIVFERSGYISYANCGLPYFIGGTITNKNALTLQTPESFKERFEIDVRTKQEVTAIDPAAKTVTVRRLEDGTDYQESYDKLILSPGAKAIRPNIPGVNSDKILTLRTVEDTMAIHDYISQSKPAAAVIVGGGYIGLEMAENLVHAGIHPTIVQMTGQLMDPLDNDMACILQGYLKEQGVSFLLNETAVGFIQTDSGIRCELKSGKTAEADFAILAAGVQPDTQLAKDAGLKLGLRGAIAVNQRMETSAPDIYAVGDAVEVTHLVSGEKALISLAGPANKQGRIAADNICGIDSQFRGAQGSSIIKLFDMTIASTGLNEKQAQNSGISYDKVVTFSPSHATYYPGGSSMTIKTLFAPDSGKILGAQLVGFDGVDKRCDVLATAIRGGMTASDLAELELTYAPPYSSAKDPVNMAGFAIENVLTGKVRQYHWHDIPTLLELPGITMLDVRTDAEYAKGHIPGTLHIPVDSLRERLGELDPSKPVYVNCQSGLRSYIACRILSQRGFTCYNLSGGYRLYAFVAKNAAFDSTPAHACGLPIEE